MKFALHFKANLHNDTDILEVEIKTNGKEFLGKLPEDLQCFKSEFVLENEILNFLKSKHDYDIFVEHKQQVLKVDYDKELLLVQKHTINVETGYVGYLGKCNGAECNNFLRLSKNLFVCLNQMKIGHCSSNADVGGEKLTVLEFSDTSFLDGICFLQDGDEVKPRQKESNLCLEVKTNEKNITFEVKDNFDNNVDFVKEFKIFVDEYENLFESKFSQQERAVCKGLALAITLCNEKNELYDLIKSAKEKLVLSKHSWLEKFHFKKFDTLQGLKKFNLVFSDYEVFFYEVLQKSYFKLISFLMIKFRTFNLDQCTIGELDFFGSLMHLKSFLNKHKIDIKINDLPVKNVKISRSLCIARKESISDINWFELRFDGEVISNDEWQKILENNLVLKRNNAYNILNLSKADINALNVLIKRNLVKYQERAQELPIFEILALKQRGIDIEISGEISDIFYGLNNIGKHNALLPIDLQCELKPFQVQSYNWINFLYKHKFGACLADDMGLGKTVQTIAFLAGLFEYDNNELTLSHLIICPKALLLNWRSEIDKFYPNFTVSIIENSKQIEDLEALLKNSDIIISTYDLVAIYNHKFSLHNFDVIVFDEAQILRTLNTKKSISVRQLKCNFRLALTGTPIENNYADFFSIMDLVIPGIIPKNSDQAIDSKNFMKIVKPFFMRRTKQEVLKELSNKFEHTIVLESTHRQKALYCKVIDEFKTNKKSILPSILKLQQICISPCLIGDEDTYSPKIEYLIKQIQELTRLSDNAILVFSRFRFPLKLIELRLSKLNILCLKLEGNASLKNRQKIIENFQLRKEVQVLLVNLKVGGVGLNITRANHIFHIEPWWNPAVQDQANDRAYRIGQNRDLNIYHLIMKDTIEAKIMDLKNHKKKLFNIAMKELATSA